MPTILLTARELAERIDVPYDRVLEWARDGSIPSITHERRRYFNMGRVIRAIRDPRTEPAERLAVPA